MINVKLLNQNDIEEHFEEICGFLEDCYDCTFGESKCDIIEEKANGLIGYVNEGKAYPFGAFEDMNLVGFLWGYPIKKAFETVFHVAYIAVKNDSRKKGIGRLLISSADECRNNMGLEHIELMVGANNRAALEFYNTQGFSVDQYLLKK